MLTQAQVDQLVAAMVANAAAPMHASNDSGSVTSRSLYEQMDAIRFVSAMRGAAGPHRGIRMNALRPAGAAFGHGELQQMDALSLTWLNRRFV